MGDDCRLPDAPGKAVFAESDFAEKESGIGGAGFVYSFDRAANGGTVGSFVNSLSLPRPTSRMRSQRVAGTSCRSSVEPALPSMSPRRIILERCWFAAASSCLAAGDSFRVSNTPMTMQALRCSSGLTIFMLNSTGSSSNNADSYQRSIITAAFR